MLRGNYDIPAFEIHAHDYVAFVGESNTFLPDLFWALSGQIPRTGLPVPPATGRVRQELFRVNLNALGLRLCDDVRPYNNPNAPARFGQRKLVGAVYSETDTSIIGRNVQEDYLHAVAAGGLDPARRQASIDLARFGIAGLIDSPTTELSDGERQRLVCATAFCGDPPLLLIDISASNMDGVFLETLLKWLDERRANGAAVLITHVPGPLGRMIASYATRSFTATRNGDTIRLTEAAVDTYRALAAGASQRAALAPRVTGEALLSVDDFARHGITTKMSLVVYEHEVVQLRGRNGAGKTTLARFLAGRLGRAKVSGRVDNRARTTVMVPQVPTRGALGLVSDELSASAAALCGIADRNVAVDRLAYSQQKLVAAAVALHMKADLVILDEPTCGMDQSDKDRLISLLNDAADRTLLIISHDDELIGFGRTVTVN